MTPQASTVPHSNLTLPELALQLVEIRGSQDMLQREVATNIQNLSSATQALQADVRHLANQVGELGRLQERQLNHSEGLERAFAEIEKMGSRLTSWIERHEAQNQSVADKVTDFGGRVRGLWLAGGLVWAIGGVAIGLAWDQLRSADADLRSEMRQSFSDAKAERISLEARVKAAHADDIARLQRQIDENRATAEQLQGTRGAR